jgi:hypothetical protein
MIISASRRTDIPALYARWFMSRVREGYALVANPMNPRQCSRVSLLPGDVDAVVFWTRNPKPMFGYLDELERRGFRYYFLFTLTGYPGLLEPGLPQVDEILSTFRSLSRRIGAARVIWRYDPVILSDITDEDFIGENFENLAKRLHGHTEEVIISFANFYRKVERNLGRVTGETGVRFRDIHGTPERVHALAARIAEAARGAGLRVSACAEPYDLSSYGIERGRCIDDGLLRRLFGLSLNLKKDPSQRKDCGCVQSRDIGAYNTCTHGCIYCYANENQSLARGNRSLHDPEAPALSGEAAVPTPSKRR